MPADVEPPELARLINFSERPRSHEWSLRAALVRYAQPEPQRVNDILDLVRRTERALEQHAAVLERDGGKVWDALEGQAPSSPAVADVVALLGVASTLDGLGDVLAEWAVDLAGARPDEEVDRVIEDVRRRLEELGVPQEERAAPPRRRG